MVDKKDFQKSDTEIELYESLEDSNFPQEYENNSVIIFDDLNQKEMDHPRVQAMLKRSRHNILSIFLKSQDYKLGKKQ